MLIFGHDRALARWAGERIGIADFGPCVAIGVSYGNDIIAAAVYNQYRHPNIEVTFVTDRAPHDRGAVREIRRSIGPLLRYPFVQLRCKRITAVTGATNQPARAFLCRLGFKQEGYHPEALPTGDAVSYGLFARDAARWLAEEAPHVERRNAASRP
jgi:RimJ/RimL family protein N-acetyltransferase